ncbi:hypothetical protein C2S51_012116 [Perilla frutescens var. frutescens]|nr:hypothetical protein C2S51_012116 [Perilla frutescens var. frutescens]
MKGAIKKAMRKGSKQQFKFQYDPHSYALNFDDGCHQEIWKRERDSPLEKFGDFPEISILIFVVWVDCGVSPTT